MELGYKSFTFPQFFYISLPGRYNIDLTAPAPQDDRDPYDESNSDNNLSESEANEFTLTVGMVVNASNELRKLAFVLLFILFLILARSSHFKVHVYKSAT